MDSHYGDIVLAAYVEGDPNIDRNAIARHAEKCDTCSANLAAYQSLAAVLSDRNIYEFASRARMGRQTLDVKVVRRWLQGRSPVDDSLNDLKKLSVEEWIAFLEERPKLQTKSLTIHLAATAHALLKRQPRVALRLCDLASGIAKRFDDPITVAEQSAEIAKERANALRVLNRNMDALESLDWAERYLSEVPGSAYDLLFVEWARATVFFAMTRYADALPLVRKVISLFRVFGDMPRVSEVRILEANIICEQGDVESAVAIYAELLTYFEDMGEVALAATLKGNLAECEVRLDHPDLAHRYAAEAANTFQELGLLTERSRVRWTLGYEMMRRGYLDQALELLQLTATEFEVLGMTIEAGKVGLDIVEVHLRAQEWEEAETLSRYLTTLFSKTEAPLHHVRAYWELREAVEARTATVDLCARLRADVKSLATSSDAGDSM